MSGDFESGSIGLQGGGEFYVLVSFRILHRISQNFHQGLVHSLGLTVSLGVVWSDLPMVNLEFLGHLADHVVKKMSTPIANQYFRTSEPRDNIFIQKLAAFAVVSILTALAFAHVSILTTLTSAHFVKYSVATTK